MEDRLSLEMTHTHLMTENLKNEEGKTINAENFFNDLPFPVITITLKSCGFVLLW